MTFPSQVVARELGEGFGEMVDVMSRASSRDCDESVGSPIHRRTRLDLAINTILHKENVVFTVSDNAVSAIHQIMAGRDVSPGAGLRITADRSQGSLRIDVSSMAEDGDSVYEAGDAAHLFIAEDAEGLLDDRTIDARKDDDGRFHFVLDVLER